LSLREINLGSRVSSSRPRARARVIARRPRDIAPSPSRARVVSRGFRVANVTRDDVIAIVPARRVVRAVRAVRVVRVVARVAVVAVVRARVAMALASSASRVAVSLRAAPSRMLRRGALRASASLLRMRFPPRVREDGVVLSTLPAAAHARELARLALARSDASTSTPAPRRRPPRALDADRVPEALRRARRALTQREMDAVDSGGAA
jgi:hypothetical protein